MIRRAGLLLLLLALVGAPVRAQMPQNYDRGFAQDKVYQYGEIDHVNHFNGNLVLTIPIGPSFPLKGTSYQMTLVYNSSIWDVMSVYPISQPSTCAHPACQKLWSYPARRFNAGQGWTLSLGRKFERYSVEAGYLGTVYQSPDGGDHPLLGAGTHDSSYLRQTTSEIDAPDGSHRAFYDDQSLKSKNGFGWLSAMHDASGNGVEVEQRYDASTGLLQEWRISDTEGRLHHVYFTELQTGPFGSDPGSPLPEQRVAVRQVVLEGPAGNMTYTFQYGLNPSTNSYTVIGNSCAGDDNTGYADQFLVPLLHTITLPDGTYYSATYTGNGTCDPGQLETFQLAGTKGQLAWTYGSYQYANGSCSPRVRDTVYGVRQRKLFDALGTLLGTWTYTPALIETPAVEMRCAEGGGTDGQQRITKMISQEVTTTVDDPFGLRTIYHFTALPELDGTPAETPVVSPSEYGFPMNRLHPNDTDLPRRYLSTEKQTCSLCDASGANCGGWYCTTVEAKFLRYVSDGTTVNSSGEVVNASAGDNPRTESEQTTAYAGSSQESVWTDRSDFDGFGHYRKTSTGGSFGGTPTRETYTDFNPGSDASGKVYDPGTGTRIPKFADTDAWVLGTYDYSWIGQNGQYARTEACFDGTTGFLSASRTLKNTGSTPAVARSSSDVMAWFTDGGGVVSKEEYFGGDVQANLVDTALCGMTKPLAAEYTIGHTYSHGARATSAYYDGTTALAPLILDRTIGAAGFPVSERDSSGLETTYTYDSSGRVRTVQPPGTSPVTYTYGFALTGVGPIGFQPASVTVDRGDTKALYQFDSLGRPWRELHQVPDGGGGTFWSMHQMDRDAAGRVIAESTPERISDPLSDLGFVPPKTTTFRYAQEGFLAGVTRPDGSVTSSTPILLSRTIKRVPFTSADGTSWISHTTYDNDPLGRLKTVSEIAYGDPATLHVTSYGYDLGGHLASVAMTRSGVTQNRAFTYDQRGFLSAETHPEKGVSGNGTTSYSLYDSRGHAGRQIDGAADGPFDLKLTYDNRERLVTVTEPDPASQTSPKARQEMKAFVYGTGNAGAGSATDYRNGKLLTATRHNRSAALGDVTVTETYHYADSAGRLTSTDTNVAAASSAFSGAAFSTTQQWNALDQVVSVGYPRMTSPLVAPDRSVSYAYANGFLTGVGTYASAITYQPSGAVDEVTHGLAPNATIQKWTADPDHMARPCSILAAPPGTTFSASSGAPCGYAITGNSGSWSSGQYRYDASGNITQIGTRSYVYDHLSRLVAERDAGLSTGYRYDGFGNMNLQTTTLTSVAAPAGGGNYDGTFTRAMKLIDVNPATNRLNGATYDAAGNITEWPAGITYEWDSTGAMRAMHSAARDTIYLYTADEERVATVSRIAGADLVPRNRTSWTMRGPQKQLLRTWLDDSTSGARTWTWSEDEIWRGSTLLATETLSGTKRFVTDHLGSPRFVTNSAGQPLGTIAFAAFGQGGATGMGALQFTGHERDERADVSAEPLDYMHARYYSASVGRFLSVDRAIESVDPGKPQSWNRYSYVRSNPLTFTDPTGRILWFSGGDDALDLLRRSINADLGKAATFSIGANGVATLTVDSGVTATKEQQAMITMLSGAISDPNVTRIAVVLNDPGQFMGKSGQDGQMSMDIGDMAASSGSCATTPGALAAHEIAEKWAMQSFGKSLDEAHAYGIFVENRIAPWQRPIGGELHPTAADSMHRYDQILAPYFSNSPYYGGSAAAQWVTFKLIDGRVISVTP
jgi:RHS repeat-associated protein